ncbi:MAG: hypothetical protein JRN52_00640 [Nitrososphaerota archaeon]|nr:hypothetical protein [Nitrososphaerota archaeon]
MTSNIRARVLRLAEAIVVIGFSVFILLSRSPAVGSVSSFPILIYYLFVPGYVLTSVLAEEYDILSRFLYSVMVGLALLLSLAALDHDPYLTIRNSHTVIIPIVAVLVEGYVYYHKKPFYIDFQTG